MQALTLDRARSIAEVKGLRPARYGARICFSRASAVKATELTWDEFAYVLRSRSLGLFQAGRGFLVIKPIKDQCPKCLLGAVKIIPATKQYRFDLYYHEDNEHCTVIRTDDF